MVVSKQRMLEGDYLMQSESMILQYAGLLRFEFQEEGDKEMQLVWTAAHTLHYMRRTRSSGHIVDLFLTRSMLESKINLMRETRHSDAATIINEIFNDIM